MKLATIPFPRQFGPGAVGEDVRAVKRALTRWINTSPHPAVSGMVDNGVFGKAAQSWLGEFKHDHGLLYDPIYTLQAHQKLSPFFDELAASWMAAKAAEIARANMRAAFVNARRWMVDHKALFVYEEVRPIPEGLAPFETSQRIVTDCSGSIEVAAKWAGCPDPSGLGYTGWGNTSTLMSHLLHITAASAAAGDVIVYRKGPSDGYGHHAVSIDKRVNTVDFQVVSHGHPGDPNYYLHSWMLAEQARDFGAYEAVFLRLV